MGKAKKTLRYILLATISLLLLTSMLLSTMLGSVNAKLFKSIKKNLSLEVSPDLNLSYYLKDELNTSGIEGSYKNSKNISQPIKTLNDTVTTAYRIKIPVDEVGYYTLSFNVDFWKGSGATKDTATDFYTRNLNSPVGCQVLHPTHFDFKSASNFIISPDDTQLYNYTYGVKRSYSTQSLLNAYNHYQWKTLAPSRGENVELTFSVVQSDVNTGYVVWAWDFTGLSASTTYTLNLNDISVTKIEANGENAPCIDFMNTQYLNNAINPTHVSKSGFTRYDRARGTYVTNATYDSMTMQVSPLYHSWNSTNSTFRTGKDGSAYENVVVLNVPMNNIKKGVSYRVSFDFSVARQGSNNLSESSSNVSNTNYASLTSSDVDYTSSYDQFFNDVDAGSTLHFQSYLHNSAVTGRTIQAQTDGRVQIQMDYKRHAGHEVTRYDEIVKSSSSTKNVQYGSQAVTSSISHAQALNSGYTELSNSSTGYGSGVNWLNAIRHTEMNGENQIYWLTFYNTSFTFNIPSNNAIVTTDDKGYCNDLFWTWAIDALEQTAWFRIKIENVRIEEVVSYGSTIDSKGIVVGNTVCNDYCSKGDATVLKNGTSVARTFRNANGTGQNYQARGYISGNVPVQSAINIFGTIYDAGDQNINGNYNISLSGYCAIKGGVEKYVWSADGGKTWHDMSGGTLGAGGSRISNYCEKFIDQAFLRTTDYTSTYVKDTYVKDEKDPNFGYTVNSLYTHTDKFRYDYVDFQKADDVNSRFQNLTADLSEYRYQHDLDIIFAAVPRTNPSLRCEILRIINYNSTKNYRTFTLEYESDISVNTSENKLNAVFHNSSEVELIYGADESDTEFTKMYGFKVDGTRSNAGGYAYRTATSHAYEDVRTLYSNMPVKTELTVRGWAIVEGGVEAYMWSADYGKTWTELDQRGVDSGRSADLPAQYSSWYSSSGSFSGAIAANAYFDKSSNGTVDNGLKIDLSSYVGRVVDIIVAAKPNGSDALCPVSRIDNVAVYGESGTFYTKILTVTAGSTTIPRTYLHLDGTALNSVTKNNTNSQFAQWKLNYGAENADEFAHTIFESNNVSVYNTRFYNNSENNIAAGANITIDGYMAAKGGIVEFRYTFDGGKTYSSIDRDEEYALHSGGVTNVIKSDASFVADDYSNGNFSASSGGAALVINIPNNLKGNTRNLLVYAVNSEGNEFPILHIRLNIT